MILIKLLFFSIIMFSLGCAPGLNHGLSVSAKSLEQEPKFSENVDQVVFIPIKIGVVKDQRSRTFIGSINGRNLLANGNVEETVKTLLENECKQRGYSVSQVAETNISAEVREWFVDIQSSFPLSTATARASVVVTTEIPATGKKFYAEYSGSAQLKHPMLNEDRIQNQLNKAMENAIKAAIADDRMAALL